MFGAATREAFKGLENATHARLRGGSYMSVPSDSRADVGPSPPEIDDAPLESVMREVPRGALAVAALTVGLTLVAWLLLYALVFLPRGTVG